MLIFRRPQSLIHNFFNCNTCSLVGHDPIKFNVGLNVKVCVNQRCHHSIENTTVQHIVQHGVACGVGHHNDFQIKILYYVLHSVENN